MSCVSENGESVIRTYLVHSTYGIFVPEATKDGKIVNQAVLLYLLGVAIKGATSFSSQEKCHIHLGHPMYLGLPSEAYEFNVGHETGQNGHPVPLHTSFVV